MATSLTKELRTGPGGPQLSCGRGFGPPFGGGGGGPDEFVPNCILNTLSSGRLSAGALVNIGVQDFAIECWAMAFGPGPDSHLWAGMTAVGAAADGIHFDLNDANIGPYAYSSFRRAIPPGGGIPGANTAAPAGWHYYVVNYDRNSLATLYIDMVSSDTVDISAAVADNKTNETFTIGAGSANTTPVAVGPVAYHINTLLTATQMADSYNRKYIQSLAATYGIWDPRFVIGATGWDSTPANFADRLYKQGIATDLQIPIPFATPEGPNGNVYIPDLSGNARHLSVITRTAYSTSAQAFVAFGTDPFWEKT